MKERSIMKRNNKKNLVCLAMALGLFVSGGILPQTVHAQTQKSKNVEVTYAQKAKKQNGTKNILVTENKKTKGVKYPLPIYDKATTYPLPIYDKATTYPLPIYDKATTYPLPIYEEAITYPDYIAKVDVMPQIVDEDEAFDYLSNVLSKISKFKMGKYFIEVEDIQDFPTATTNQEEWYFAYGKEVKGEFVPSKYFAVSEKGEIFEYSFEKDRWFILAVPYKK